MNAGADTHHARSRIAFGIAAVALAWIAWRALTMGMGELLSASDTAAALSWRPGQEEAQLLQAEEHTRSGHGDIAPEVRQAIRAAPLDGRGYRLLARQAERRGQRASATELYRLAAARGPRDLASQGWLANDALARGDYSEAMARIDWLLRVQPEVGTRLGPVLLKLATRAPAQQAMAKTLALRPPWREGFVRQLVTSSPDSARISGLIDRLRRSPSGLSDAELDIWLRRLAHDRQWGTAYLTWVQSLGPAAALHIGNVYNGSFELEPSNIGFDWHFAPLPGVQVSRSQVSGADGHLALRVAFEDRRVPFKNVRQLLALPAGKYRLQGESRLDSLRSERGLVWTLSCAESGRVIAETDPFYGQHDWRDFALDLEVPAGNCGGQWLTLRIPARIAAEQRIGGVAWFDHLRIKANPHPVELSTSSGG